MIKTLWPWHTNVKKRLVKRAKLYFQDSGLFHSLSYLETEEQLTAHPKLGASWEGFARNHFCRFLGKDEKTFFFWATHSGAEVDLFWQDGGKNYGAEFKYMDAPKLTKSMKIAVGDLNLNHLFVVYPGKMNYKLSDKVFVLSFENLMRNGKLLIQD